LFALGFERIDHGAIVHGIHRLVWPGRLETVTLEAFCRPRVVHLDGAHNLAGAKALAAHLLRNRDSNKGKRKPNLLFGSLRGKNATAALEVLATEVERIWLTLPTSHRALPAEGLLEAIRRRDPSIAGRCSVVAPFAAALEQAIDDSADGLIVCGSLYSVGEARTWLGLRFGTPLVAPDIDLFSDTA